MGVLSSRQVEFITTFEWDWLFIYATGHMRHMKKDDDTHDQLQYEKMIIRLLRFSRCLRLLRAVRIVPQLLRTAARPPTHRPRR